MSSPDHETAETHAKKAQDIEAQIAHSLESQRGDHHRNEMRERLDNPSAYSRRHLAREIARMQEEVTMQAPGSERVTDEALIAAMLYRMLTSHTATAVLALQDGNEDNAGPSKELLDAISDVRERIYLIRRAAMSPIGRDQLAATAIDARDASELMVSLELAWCIIANVNEGDWEKQSPEWCLAAQRWHTEYFCTKAVNYSPTRSEQLSAISEVQWKSLAQGTFDIDAMRAHDGPTHNED